MVIELELRWKDITFIGDAGERIRNFPYGGEDNGLTKEDFYYLFENNCPFWIVAKGEVWQ